MNAKDVILQTYELADTILNAYLGDLNDADLMIRPVEGQNHIAWQLGHLITSERRFVETIKPGSSPPLPEGFEPGHSKDARTSDDPGQFATKHTYVELYRAQRAATKKVLAG